MQKFTFLFKYIYTKTMPFSLKKADTIEHQFSLLPVKGQLSVNTEPTNADVRLTG